jgi:thiamine biosynthesis protein ThiS
MIQVNSRDVIWHEGMTIANLLESLDDPYPYAAVRINDRLVTKPDFNRYQVPDGSEVFLMPLISGG